MWKLIFYKEWLKVRWFLGVFSALGILLVGYVILMFRHRIAFANERTVLYAILFQNYNFFELLKYVPLAGGLILALAQYLPEVVNKRLKLSFHLPLPENKLLMTMQGFGALSLLISSLLIQGLFVCLCFVYFPWQLVVVIAETTFPWILAGFTSYFYCGLVILEPKWLYRFFYSLSGAAFLPAFFQSAAIGVYGSASLFLFLVTVILSVAILFSGYRYRKGEM